MMTRLLLLEKTFFLAGFARGGEKQD